MKAAIACGLGLTLIFGTAPVRADFKYTETSEITGGSLKSMMKMVSVFSKQASQVTKPTVTTKYVKGDKLRMEHSDGTITIIDVAAHTITNIDMQKRTYSVTTFEQMKAAMEKAQQRMQDKMAEAKAKQKDPQNNVQTTMQTKVYVTPTTATREILGQMTKESKMQIDMEVTAQQDPSAAPTSTQQSAGPASGTMSTNIDSWVAPSIAGYKEFADFYIKMAKEINWTPPSGLTVNPQVSQGMAEYQKNQGALKGLPLLQYVSMTMAAAPGSQPATAQTAPSTPPPSTDNSIPTSPSQAMVKGLGGLFNKKKKDPPPADPNSASAPPAPSTPGSLMEMTIQVNSFSDATLEGSLFQPPPGFTQVQQDPDQVFGQRPAKK